jgi:DNA-binding transcriptional MocR family regulator
MPTSPINLGTCYPRVEGQEELVRQHLLSILENGENDFAAPRPPQGSASDLQSLQPFLVLEGSGADIALTPSGQGALAVALLAGCSSSGVHVAVEEWTFPNALSLLRQIGAKVTILPMDEHGLVPEALESACKAGLQVLYTMPTVHNPIGITMPVARRREVVSIAERYGLFIVEDEAYASLEESNLPPLQTFLPDRTIRMVSLSKTFSLSLRLGAVVYPKALSGIVIQRMRMIGSLANPMMSATAASMARVGIMDALARSKRREGAERQETARAIFGEGYRAHPTSWYGMLDVSMPGRLFAERACEAGVIVSPGAEYRADGADPSYIRVSLGAETSPQRLIQGLEIVERLRRRR